MKFSEQGQRNFYDHFHFLDGTVEDFEFKGSDIEGGVVILSVDKLLCYLRQRQQKFIPLYA